MIKIISGGQTGADRAGLDVAIRLKLLHGGWCPAGRKAEDGKIPDCYNLKETNTSDYETRTEMNVRDSDGTIVFTQGAVSGGSKTLMHLHPVRNDSSRGNKDRQTRRGILVGNISNGAGGSALTIQMAQKYDKPCLHIDLNLMDDITTVKRIRKWLKTHEIEIVEKLQQFHPEPPTNTVGDKLREGSQIKILNIAGSRESESPGIYNATKKILFAVFN